ncbi:hypothetical protein A8L34_10685 [Bacillus sp. FJAT-27264]|nr:hypothetical protein A8L34_10685 [Bacillus sp. FJAT-27264]
MSKRQDRLKDRTNKFMPGKVAELVKWNNKPLLDEMIDDDTPVKEMVAWCNDNGFQISIPTMYSYIKQRREAIINGFTMELIHSKEDTFKKALKDSTRKKAGEKGNAKYKENRAEDRAKAKQIMAEAMDQVSPKQIKHDLELLDEVIQKGFKTLNMMEVVSPVTAIKAIEMKHKLFNGGTGGHTLYGLEEIKVHEAAREQAIIACLMEFIPEEQREAAVRLMDNVTREYYQSIGLGEAYAQIEAKEAIEDQA